MYIDKPGLHKRQATYTSGTLRTIAFDVTSRCNMACKHCYATTFNGTEGAGYDVLKRLFDEAYDMGVSHYVVQGGEPITDPERLERSIAMMHPDETYINVVSNGWRMDREAIRWLKSIKVDKIAFSLDSGVAAEHDQNRLEGSYDRVLAAIEDTLAEGLLSSISTVVTHESLYGEGFRLALNIARERNIRIDVQIAMPVGKWDGRRDVLITPEDAKYIKGLQESLGTLPNGQRAINRDIFNYGGVDHCPAGVEFMAVTANGNILPCNFCQFTLGDIRTTSLRQAREKLIANRWFNGSSPRCLLGEDEEFFAQYVAPNVERPKPLDAYALFGLGDSK